jgi:capsular exopolysaccharide synthesis family protein
MDLQDLVRLLRKNLWLLVATTLVGAGAAAAYSFTRVPLYEATSTVFVSTQTGDTAQELNQGSNFTQARVKSYATLATTPLVLGPVVSALQLPLTETDLDEQIEADTPPGTTLIAISVTDPDPARAAAVSNAVAGSLTTAVQQIETPSGQTVSPVKLSLVRPAEVPLVAVSPRLKLDLAVGLLIGLLIGLGTAVLRRLLDTRIHGERDVAAITDTPVISSIVFDARAAERPLIVHLDPRSPRAEAFRTLRTNLQFLDVAGSHSFLVSSSVPAEGKSTTAVNLAIALADAGSRVILVDADLRRSKVSDYMGVEGGAGLTDVLIGRAEVDDVVQRWGAEDLFVLPAGKIPPNPSELLGSAAMAELIKQFERDYDVVIFDAPPLLPVTDAAVLAKRVGGAIMVVATGRTSRHQLTAALGALEHVGAHVAGLVLSMVPVKGPDSYGYAYGYGYGYSYGPEVPATKRSHRRRKEVAATATADLGAQVTEGAAEEPVKSSAGVG